MRAPRQRRPKKKGSSPNLFSHWLGLDLLYQGWLDAHKHQRDLWGFAVEIEELIEQGVSRSTLRELLVQGLAEHSQEQTRAGSSRMTFRPIQNLSLPKRTCFVLTQAGADLAQQARKERANEGQPQKKEEKGAEPNHPAIRPSWDGARLLRWGEEVIKEFRRAATMQTRILDAFEAANWTQRIENPLPRLSGVNRKQHLRETIKNLNRGLTKKRIRFYADGSGLGICWMPVLRR